MKKWIQRLVLFALVFACVSPLQCGASSASVSADLEVFSDASATSFLLMDGDTGDVLSSRNADKALPMASTTKIMTCLVALEKGVISDEVSIPQAAVGVEGSSVYLTKGEKLRLEELLYALMLESANDAAVAIALHISGSIDSFAEMMNEKAAELEMTGTHYVNPHGLPADGHYSTARDLCKLMRYCMQNEAFRVFTGTGTISISAPGGKTRFLSNHNKLLRLYEGCTGGKTGFTKEAGRCLVSSAKRDGKELICATLGDPNDWKDHSALFDYGFSLYSQRTIASPGSVQFSIPVVGGEKEELRVSNTDSLTLPLRSEENVTCSVELPRFIYASIEEGSVIGEAVFSKNGEELERLPLKAEHSISKSEEKLSFWKRLWQAIRLWFN